MARFIEVDGRLRTRLRQARDDLGLGPTSQRELGLSYNTIRLLESGAQTRFRIASIALLCANLGLKPEELEELGHKPLAAELRRITPEAPSADPYARNVFRGKPAQ